MQNDFTYEVVVYDEVEKFNSYSNSQFNYPYVKRRTKVSGNTF